MRWNPHKVVWWSSLKSITLAGQPPSTGNLLKWDVPTMCSVPSTCHRANMKWCSPSSLRAFKSQKPLPTSHWLYLLCSSWQASC